MPREVLLTEEAERDLEEIHRYIALRDGTARALSVLTALETTCLRLEELAERGNVPKELRDLGIGEYREVHYKPYRILYRIVGDRVFILAALDGRRDMQTLLLSRLLR